MSAVLSAVQSVPAVERESIGRGAAPTVGQLLEALEAQARLTQQLASRLEALSERLEPSPPAAAEPHELDTALRDGTVSEAPSSRVAMYCFGTFRFYVDGTPVRGWRAGKTRALLQYLATHHDRPVPRETLIGELWPNPDAAAAGTSLKVAVHALRQALAQLPPAPPAAPALSVVAHEAGYQLSATDLWLDVEAFERCCALGRRLEARGRSADALPVFARAADLYSGDFLSDSWDDWVVFRREGLKDQYLFVVARLADAALAAGDFQGCIMRCQQLLVHDRCREDTYRTLMLCHARLGQRDRVRCWFDLCVRTLRAELGVGPEAETLRLYRRAIRADGPRAGGLTAQ
jgi:DNA-binding SARP family transcriptional activator